MKHDIRVLATVHKKQVSIMFMGYFKLCPLRPNIIKRTLNIPCNGNKPKQIYTLQITEVSNSVKRHADNSGNRQTGDL